MSEAPPSPGHETPRSGYRLVWIGAGVVALALLLIHAALDRFASRFDLAPPPSGPALGAVALDVEARRARARARLASYGWVDRERGIAHIPVAAAMERLVRRHAAADGDAAR